MTLRDSLGGSLVWAMTEKALVGGERCTLHGLGIGTTRGLGAGIVRYLFDALMDGIGTNMTGMAVARGLLWRGLCPAPDKRIGSGVGFGSNWIRGVGLL